MMGRVYCPVYHACRHCGHSLTRVPFTKEADGGFTHSQECPVISIAGYSKCTHKEPGSPEICGCLKPEKGVFIEDWEERLKADLEPREPGEKKLEGI